MAHDARNLSFLESIIFKEKDAEGCGGEVFTTIQLFQRFQKQYPHLEFGFQDLEAVIGLLSGAGVISALPYGSLVQLKPQWLNNYGSTIVKMAREDNLGHVPVEMLQAGRLPDDGTPRLQPDDETQILPHVVGIFLERGIAWMQETARGSMLVFPSYVRLPRSEPPPRPGRTVIYRFKGTLEEVYSTLVVALHYSGLFRQVKLYRQAADFYTASGRLAALTMREEGENGELEIYFGQALDPDVQAAFQRFIHEHLSYKAVQLVRIRHYYCPVCNEEVKDRSAVVKALGLGRVKLLCQYCDPDKPSLILIKDVLEDQFATGAGADRAIEMERRAQDEISAASKEQIMVGEVMSIVAAANQIFRSITVRDEGVDAEIEFTDDKGRGTRRKIDLQLKSGDSHIRSRKNGTQYFPLTKAHYERYWGTDGSVPVYLIVRFSTGKIMWMNATKTIKCEQEKAPGKRLTQIPFNAGAFDEHSVIELRNEAILSFLEFNKTRRNPKRKGAS